MISKHLLFCEGADESVDSLVLGRLYAGLVEIRPCGGKGALQAYVKGYTRAHGTADARYLVIRDRDFDEEPTGQLDEPPLIVIDEHVMMWSRHEIENYLLDPPILACALEEGRRWPPLAHIPAHDEAAAGALLERAARRIVYFEASRWTLGQIQRDRPIFMHRWGPDAPHLPEDLTLERCRREALKRIEKIQDAVQKMRPSKATDLFDGFVQRFSTDEFFSASGHLSWFSGKDLLTAVLLELELPPSLHRSLHGALLNAGVKALAALTPEARPRSFVELEHRIESLRAM